MTRKFYYGLGRPFSPLYSVAMRLRERLYQRGTFKSSSFAVPVISVGNLTLGGTGKTPMVQYLARLLQEKGYQPAIFRGVKTETGSPEAKILPLFIMITLSVYFEARFRSWMTTMA
ncbi:MAG: hypothetical protein D3904_17220, partial [Candidatus Electrothrix sp. EH2]|nr:hypothetical protein [Candidatus Electrothrix sp. EH2]